MKLPFRVPLFIVALLSLTAAAQPTLTDAVSFETFSVGDRLHAYGWPITYARSGGWGKYPQDYTYQVMAAEQGLAVVGSYRFAQNHGHGSAIPIDWDGNPANGRTALEPVAGLHLVFRVSAYIQPYAKGWRQPGSGHVIWGMGPGLVPPDADTFIDRRQDDVTYNWAKGRGPRLQYRIGADVDGRELKAPELTAYASESSEEAITALTLGDGGTWYDLQLEITFTTPLRDARCRVRSRPAAAATWEQEAVFRVPVNLAADDTTNPKNWNALLLDMPLGQWSKKGYGRPTPAMMDRYDDFTLRVIPPDADGTVERASLFAFKRREIGFRMQGPEVLFREEPSEWRLTVVNGGRTELRGKLSVRTSGDRLNKNIASSWRLPPDSRHQVDVELPPFEDAGERSLQVVYEDDDGESRVLGTVMVKVLDQALPRPSQNILRNASFEYDSCFNGGPMRQADEHYMTFLERKHTRVWQALDTEAWWAEGPDTDGITRVGSPVHSGSQSLKVTAGEKPRSAVSAYGRYVPAGPLTLTAWVRTENADASLDLDLATGWHQGSSRAAEKRTTLTLPANADWTRVQTALDSPKRLQAVVRLRVSSGTVYFDDVQLETGRTASPFNLRPLDRVRLSFADTGTCTLPKWGRDASATQQLQVHNDSRQPLSGTLELFRGPWDHTGQRRLARIPLARFQSENPVTLPLETGGLEPDAYVVHALLKRDGKVVMNSREAYAPETTIGGRTSNGMLRARSVIRFAVAPDHTPATLFGVGNGMLQTAGSYWKGYPIRDFAVAGDLGIICGRGRYKDPVPFLLAAGGYPVHGMGPRVDGNPPEGSDFTNPAHPEWIDFYHPDGREFFRKRAEDMGRDFAANPFMASFQMSNESPYLNRGRLCPSKHADAAFRQWCRKRHGKLATLNKRWNTTFRSWNDVEQLISARFLEIARDTPQPEGAAAIDWTASTGRFSAQVLDRMRANPGWAMDWLRWRTDSSLEMYAFFRRHARKHDKKTLYSTNLCWPSFWPQMFMRFTRRMDVTMLDCQYTSGFKRALGNPYEMIDILEMAESSAPQNPIWGIEIYVQPQFPPRFVALQNWGLVAHGMSNNLVFGWKPYSDHGPVKGTRAWEKPGARPMWMLTDNDGTRLPHFNSYRKSLNEIHAYHRRFNGLTIKRSDTDTALYVSPDTGEYVIMETGNKPWGSAWQRTRNNLAYLLRMNGVTADYVDSETLPDAPGKYRKIVVPASKVLSQADAAKLATFTKRGGTLILAGITGLVDPWLRPYENVGGPAWSELNWKAPEWQDDYARVSFDRDLALQPTGTTAAETPASEGGKVDRQVPESKTFRGVNPGTMQNAEPLDDARGQTVGWQRKWGKGRIIAYGVFPDIYTSNPHPPRNLTAWTNRLIEQGALTVTGTWQPESAGTSEGHLGSGDPVVEVVVREKTPGDRFVFCLNQGGAGAGRIEIPLPAGQWQARDIINSEPMARGRFKDGLWTCPLKLDPWDYRVIRLHNTGSAH